MACFPLKTSVVTGMVCTGRQRRAKCSSCGGRAEVLCDFPVTRKGQATTCSAKICKACAVKPNAETDHCPPHARLAAAASSPRVPARGDVRRHEMGTRLWVVQLLEGGAQVMFCRSPPDRDGHFVGTVQTVPIEKWREKTTPAPPRVGRCRACDAPMGWCKTADGKDAPIDIEPHPDGNLVIDQDGVALYAQRGSFPVMYLSHFATCIHADRFKRKR